MKPSAAKRVKEAIGFLASIGLPREQQNERSALTLLALCDLRPRDPWSGAKAPLRRITEMMDWMLEQYGVRYAPNTRETIRRQSIHQFVQVGLVIENPDDPRRPINSPKWCYQISAEALHLIRMIGLKHFGPGIEQFKTRPAPLSLETRHRVLPRETVSMPDGSTLDLSVGGQSVLIRAVVEEFAPRFVRDPRILFIGDAGNKELLHEKEKLANLGVKLPQRGKAPDVLILDGIRDWLIIVEAATSHGPIDQKRKNELAALFSKARPGLVFVSAFPDRKAFSRFHAAIAWETDVWLADTPDHLIHFNGERFLGPYS